MNQKDKKDIYKNIAEYTKLLKLPGIRKYYEDEIKESLLKDTGYEEFLLKLLMKENDLRQERAKDNRIKYANFPYKKYLEDISVSDLPSDAQEKYNHLKSLEFIKNGQNVILAGNPGIGKAHLGIGLGTSFY